MGRPRRRRVNPRRRVINQGGFLRLEQKLLEDEKFGSMTTPSRFAELEEAVAVAVQASPEQACLDLLASMVIDNAKHLFAIRAAVNRTFHQREEPYVYLSGAPELADQSRLLKLTRAEDRLIRLINVFVQTRGRLARTRRTEARIDPVPLRVVSPDAPSTENRAKAV